MNESTHTSSQSPWMLQSPSVHADTLQQDEQFDVCIVGGGVAGMTTALLAARDGLSVAVLDAGGGETARSTAHLASALDDRFTSLESEHGDQRARLAAESHAFAIDLIERLCSEESIACDFERVTGFLLNASDDDDTNLENEREAAERAGLRGARLSVPPGLAPSAQRTAIEFPDQAQCDPLAYLHGLTKAASRHGARIFRARVVDLKYGAPHVAVTQDGHAVRCTHLVVATNSPIESRFEIHLKQSAYRTYAIAARVPVGAIPHALYWDTLDPYHYARVARSDRPDEELLIVGGEDHRTGDETPVDVFDRLERWTREHFDDVGEVRFRWSGQIMEPGDSLGYAGRSTVGGEHCYLITGDSGHGMTHGTLGGHLVTALIGKRDVAWQSVYEPDRKTLAVAREVVGQAAHAVAHYGAHITPADVSDAADIPPNTGCIMRDGIQQLAVFRDQSGVLHKRSATCSHLGCVVRWNAVEQSWDCPCHGSRFAVTGEVLNAPAVKPLEEASPAHAQRGLSAETETR